MRAGTIVISVGVLASAAMLLALSPSERPDPLAQRLGRECKVQLRRDYLGAACPIPVSFSVDQFQGAPVSIVGELTGVNDQWLAVRTVRREATEARVNARKEEIWIPRDAVLIILFEGE